MNEKISKKILPQLTREMFIGVLLVSLICLFVFSLFSEKSFYPFIKFKMFDRVVMDPITTVFYISAVDENNTETIITKKLMPPMSLREIAALLNSANESTRKVVVQSIMNRARAEFRETKIFRLYEYKCDCYNYYEKNHDEKLSDFIAKTCKRKIVLEKKYE